MNGINRGHSDAVYKSKAAGLAVPASLEFGICHDTFVLRPLGSSEDLLADLIKALRADAPAWSAN